MRRIIERDLQGLCDRLNELTSSPSKQWIDGSAQIGNFHISSAYGGHALHRMHNTAGGVEDILNAGYRTKRELYEQIHAYIRGIESEQNRGDV